MAIALYFGSIYKQKRTEAAFKTCRGKSLSTTAEPTNYGAGIKELTTDYPKPAALQRQQKAAPPTAAAYVPTAPPPEQVIEERSRKAIHQFTQEAHLKFDPPGNIKFVPLDTDEGFIGMYGEDSVQNAKVTGLAHSRDVPPDQVSIFKTEPDAFPNLARNKIARLSPAEELPPPPPGSGLSKGTIWTGTLENGDSVNAVYLQRSDKRGSYLFVLSGPEKYFINNDGAFDDLYEKVKALPPEKK